LEIEHVVHSNIWGTHGKNKSGLIFTEDAIKSGYIGRGSPKSTGVAALKEWVTKKKLQEISEAQRQRRHISTILSNQFEADPERQTPIIKSIKRLQNHERGDLKTDRGSIGFSDRTLSNL